MPQSFVKFDVCIIGAGFGGGLLAWILARAGQSVLLLDRNKHPRFAIGESSTPLADFLLERLSHRYKLSELLPLCRWGSWQTTLPEIRAGKKRGFSYYAHKQGQPFDDDGHRNSLMVAASVSDDVSDTHWMRSDVDHWITTRAKDAGAAVWEEFRLTQIDESEQGWTLRGTDRYGHAVSWESSFMVDSSGSGSVLPTAIGLEDMSDTLKTRTSAIFGHFLEVGSMTEVMRCHEFETASDPFDGDDAAQHHILEDGSWLWMLRFIDGTTSVGLVEQTHHTVPPFENPEGRWRAMLQNYPTVRSLLENATLADPCELNGEPSLGAIHRISRLWSRCAGTNWALLPGTAGIVDPLHSTGIAHVLSGVGRLAELLLHDPPRKDLLHEYSEQVISEVRWIDSIIDVCYLAMQHSFELFKTACSFYFFAAVRCERRIASKGTQEGGFLLAGEEQYRQGVEEARQRIGQISSPAEEQQVLVWMRSRLAKWDDIGLLSNASQNRIWRSAASK